MAGHVKPSKDKALFPDGKLVELGKKMKKAVKATDKSTSVKSPAVLGPAASAEPKPKRVRHTKGIHPGVSAEGRAKQIASLKPCQPGEIRNPWGKRGKDGTKGVTLKESYRTFLQKLDPQSREAIWWGLLGQASQGNTNAVKLMVELGGEQVNDKLIDLSAELPKITITIVDPLHANTDG